MKTPAIRGSLRYQWGLFKKNRRAYVSYLILMSLFLISLPAELICNRKPLVFTYDGTWHFPIIFRYSETDFGGLRNSEPDWASEDFISFLEGRRSQEKLVEKFSKELETLEENFDPKTFFQEPQQSKKFIKKSYSFIWPPVRYDYAHKHMDSSLAGHTVLASPFPGEHNLYTGEAYRSSWLDGHYLGTDDRGRDVLARLIYGFRLSMLFGVGLAIMGTVVGTILGGMQGYFAGLIDLIGQRVTEIWGALPRLMILLILSAILSPSMSLLFVILLLTAWMHIATYMRGEFLKARNRDYVISARALGASNSSIMFRHILPNSLTPVITFFPFEVTSGIMALVSLDFLGLGVPAPTPSLGELLMQSKNNLDATWIALPTFLILTATLVLLTFMGDGIRDAFDPKKN